MSLQIGEHYEVVEELRRGAWVTVYEAKHTILGRRTLIKWLNPGYRDDAELVGRLRREARLGASVDHPNVARIYEVGDADDRPYVAIEWIEGRDLDRVLEEEGPFSAERAITLARDLLSGLAAIHGVGIVHRDLSPMNVRITPDGVARITDFGLATGPFDTHYTLPGSVVGTPGYLSPEQASGKGADIRSDLFSCGVLLHEAITGEPLFRDDDLITTLKRVRGMAQPPLEERFEELPAGFDAWLGKLLEKKPDDRFPDARTAMKALTGLAGVEAHEPHPVRRRGKSWRGVLALGAVTVLVAAALLPVYLKRSEPAGSVELGDTTLAVQRAADTTSVAGSDTEAFHEEPLPASPETRPDSTSPTPEPRGGREQDDLAVRTARAPGEDSSGRDAGSDRPGETTSADRETVAETPVAEKFAEGDGWLVVHSQPWAEVYLDARRVGATPGLKAIRHRSGDVRLTLDNPGFPPIPFDTTVIAAETTEVTVHLDRYVASLFVAAAPWAHVYLDDVPVGETPITRPLYLSPGQHRVRFTHPEFGEVERDVIAVGGETLNLSVNMSREGTRFAPDTTGGESR